MTTIRAADTGRLTIAEAKRLILENSPREKFLQVYRREDGKLLFVPDAESKSIFAGFLDEDFASTCEQLGIVPRWKYRPTKTGYTGDPAADNDYTIAREEMERFAELHGVTLDAAIARQAAGLQASEARAPKLFEAPPLEDWKMRVQAEATAYWLRVRKTGANPTKASIRPHLLKWCQENNILTKIGVNPSDGYLKTHVLGKWEPPR